FASALPHDSKKLRERAVKTSPTVGVLLLIPVLDFCRASVSVLPSFFFLFISWSFGAIAFHLLQLYQLP
ncbi:MAG: hypothetical protein QXX37_01360, partial [Ignisphaera sp.]